MKEYHKIQTLFKRDMNNHGKIIQGDWTLPEFEFLKNNRWVFTEKVDGTNIRISMPSTSEARLIIGGRTEAAQLPATLVESIINLIPVERFRSTFDIPDPSEITLYGEGYGAKIQKGGGNYRKDQSFVLFDVSVGNWWLQRPDVEDIAQKLGIEVVPIVGEGTLMEAVNLTRMGIQSRWGEFWAEGLVLRPKVELKTRSGHRIIGKIKSRDFDQYPED